MITKEQHQQLLTATDALALESSLNTASDVDVDALEKKRAEKAKQDRRERRERKKIEREERRAARRQQLIEQRRKEEEVFNQMKDDDQLSDDEALVRVSISNHLLVAGLQDQVVLLHILCI